MATQVRLSTLARLVKRQHRLVAKVEHLEMRVAFNPQAQPASLARLMTLWLDLWVTSLLVNLLAPR